MPTPKRILFVYCFLLGGALPLAANDVANSFEDGLALVTTAKGDISFTSPDGKERQADLHAVETLTGLDVTSGQDEHVFFALSNGSALGIYENSQLRIERYHQRPFRAGRESLDYEPSRSELVVQLREGSLSFSVEHLSPLSKMIIQLPVGRIQVYEGSGRVLYHERGSRLTITSGIVGYDYPGSSEQEFVNAPKVVRINHQSGKLGRAVEATVKSDPTHKETERLVDATHRSRERVIFKVLSAEAAIPRPSLVADPEAWQAPTPRPYTYRD